MMWRMTCNSTLDNGQTCGHTWTIPAEEVKGGLRCPVCLRWKVVGKPAPTMREPVSADFAEPTTTPLDGEAPPPPSDDDTPLVDALPKQPW